MVTGCEKGKNQLHSYFSYSPFHSALNWLNEMRFFALQRKITLQNRIDYFLKSKADITVYRGFVFWQIWNNINRNNSKKKEKKERSCFFLGMALLKEHYYDSVKPYECVNGNIWN